MEKKLIGYVGVDSGQLMMCDPCYIDGEWKQKEFEDIRIHKHKTTGDKLQYRVDFENYEQVIPRYSKTMNELNATGEWEDVVDEGNTGEFSYDGCCKATLSKQQHGQLNYKLGHPGVAVAFRTAWGDGTYPVYAIYDKSGTLKKVEVHF